jgi:DNA-binding transcriptional LysR family regulator
MNAESAIDLELLRRFLAVAQAHSVRKAASTLGLTQPPLTRSIQQLEERLGTPLVERRNDGIGLTQAGHLLAQQGPSLLEHSERLWRATKGVNEARRLNVGFYALHGPIIRAIADFTARLPGCELHLRQLPTAEQHRRLLDGTLDVGFVFGGPTELAEGFQSRVLVHNSVTLAVPARWPIAQKPRVSLADLAGLPFIGSSREANPFRREKLEERCRAAGFTPQIAHECTQMSDCLKLVSLGLGVSLVTTRSLSGQTAGVRCVPLDEDLSDLEVQLIMIWLEQNTSPARRHFLDSVDRTVFGGTGSPSSGPPAARSNERNQHG